MLKFISYWTELDKSGRKQRWEKQETFEVVEDYLDNRLFSHFHLW